MRKPLLVVALLCICVTVSSQPRGCVASGPVGKATNTWAIIIGVADYENLPRLQFSPNDALALKDWLIQRQQLDSTHVFCFINEEANSVNIFDKLYLVSDSLQPGDRFIFYFSGHGDWESRLTDNALLLLSKAPRENYLRYPDQYISCHTLNEVLKKLSDRNVKTILIADACHSGKLSGGVAGAESTNLQLKKGWKNDLRILSCMPDEVSFEDPRWGGGRGVFSYYLDLAFNGMTRKNNYDPFDLTASELRSYLEENIRRETEGKQNPLFEGDCRTIITRVYPRMQNADVVKRKNIAVAKGPSRADPKLMIRIVYDFNDAIARNNLVEPDDFNALGYLRKLQQADHPGWEILKNKLLTAIQQRFWQYVKVFYSETGYPKENLLLLKKELGAALLLTSGNGFLYKEFYSKKLFIDACILTWQGQHGLRKTLLRSELLPAIDSLLKALLLTPFEPLLYKKLGECYSPVDPKRAIQYYKRFIQLVPKDASAYNAIGIAHFQFDEYPEAIEAFKKAIALEPHTAKFYYNAGIVYDKMGNSSMAREYYLKASKVHGECGIEY